MTDECCIPITLVTRISPIPKTFITLVTGMTARNPNLSNLRRENIYFNQMAFFKESSKL